MVKNARCGLSTEEIRLQHFRPPILTHQGPKKQSLVGKSMAFPSKDLMNDQLRRWLDWRSW